MPPMAAAASQEKSASRPVWTTGQLAQCAASRLGRCRVFQRLGKCPRHSSNDWKPLRNGVSSRRLWRRDSSISTPAMFQVPFSPGCVLFRAVMRSTTSAHRRPFTPPVESRHFKHSPPKPPGKSPRVSSLRLAIGAICFSGGRPAGRSSRSRARHRSGWRGLAVAGVGPLALRGSASPGSLRAHPSRHGETPCHAGCFALRSQEGMRSFFAPKPAGKWGLRSEKCSSQNRLAFPSPFWQFLNRGKRPLDGGSSDCRR